MPIETTQSSRWYAGVTRYQWLVLLIASLGWVFDVFEGQIFVASMKEAMPSLVEKDTAEGAIAHYNNIALGAFLLGGATGGIVFGMLSDRIGRKRTMSLTILFYSVFTCVSAFSQEWWHLAGFRFLVAMGVGGEWAVASSMVAEVFPKRARAHVGGIFHASSVFGTYLAVLAGVFIIGNPHIHGYAEGVGMPSLPWRLGFAVGAFPALLILWIRTTLREPESWQEARTRAQADPSRQMGAIRDLFRGELLRHTFIGVTLAAVGLATFWGAHIYGKDVLHAAVERSYIADARGVHADLTPEETEAVLTTHRVSLKRWEMLGMFLVTTGGGLGLVSFGPICERIGRRGAFLLFHLGGVTSALILYQMLEGVPALFVALPIFGFLTLGMHAGYAIYFPELYPTRLRGTGTGFCFNAGRILAAPILFVSGWMQKDWGFTLENAATILSLLFLLGALLLLLAPETRGRDLPDDDVPVPDRPKA